MESVGLKEEDALDRTKWKNDIHNHSGDPRLWEKPEEGKKDNTVTLRYNAVVGRQVYLTAI